MPEWPGLPLTVRVVSAPDGSPVARARVALDVGGTRTPLGEWPAGHRLPSSPAAAGQEARLRLAVEAPPGFAAEVPDGVFAFDVTVCRWATELEVVVPLRRELPLEVDVVRASGRPARGLEVLEAWLGGRPWPVTARRTDARGRAVIRGLPDLRGEAVRVATGSPLRRDGRGWWAWSGSARIGDRPLLLRVVLPPRPTSAFRRGAWRGPVGEVRGCSLPELPGEGTGRIDVRAWRRDGRPASGALVRCRPAPSSWSLEARADGDGAAAFEALPAGRFVVEVSEPGYVPRATEVDLALGGSASVDLHEAEGGTARVRVVDDAGRPVPFARIDVLAVASGGHASMRGDVQVVSPWTDAAGHLELSRLPLGTVTLGARFGSRRTWAHVETGGDVTIRLPAARD